jgi:hypothetical protein
LEEGAAGKRAVWHGRGVFPLAVARNLP